MLLVAVAGLGFMLYRDEATGVCVGADGVCQYSTPNQCTGEWHSTKDFYSAEATCRELEYTSCTDHRCRR